jgi:signal transduction histidine kinase
MLTGLAVIQPNLLRKNTLPPPVVIERLRVNGQVAAALDISGEAGRALVPPPVNLHTSSAALRLGPGIKQMEVEFTALSLASPENVTFRYKLEGMDQDWVDAGAVRFARYPRVPPGDYRFHVTACGHDGIWNDTGASLAFSVRPYLWEATWFRIAAGVFAAGLFGGGLLLAVRRRYRRKIERLEHRQALERERTRIAQDLHDDLGSGLVEINLGSELAQDTTLGVGEVREHTREIGARAREMVTALDEIVWAVNPKHDTLASLATYFCQYAQHFFRATPVRCHLAVAKDLPAAPLNAEQRHSLFLAFKEALCNAVRHSGATDLQLTIAAPKGMLIVTVSDNGRGLDPAAPGERVGADGLGNMRRRLQQLGGHCELTSVLGKGTTVTFRVPLAGPAARSGRNSIEVL